MLISSISAGVACATANASALRRISRASHVRSSSSSCFESFSPRMRRLRSSTTAAATTGPASGPRPASSTPAIVASEDTNGRKPVRPVTSGLLALLRDEYRYGGAAPTAFSSALLVIRAGGSPLGLSRLRLASRLQQLDHGVGRGGIRVAAQRLVNRVERMIPIRVEPLPRQAAEQRRSHHLGPDVVLHEFRHELAAGEEIRQRETRQLA